MKAGIKKKDLMHLDSEKPEKNNISLLIGFKRVFVPISG